VVGDKLTVALAGMTGAEVTVSVDDLAREDRWRAVRKLVGAKSETYLKGVTAFKLYVGDASADDFLEKAKAVGVDLGLLASSLTVGTSPDGDEGPAIAMGGGGDAEPVEPKQPGNSDAIKVKRALQQNARDRQLITVRNKLFPEADVIGYDGSGGLEPAYDFTEQQDFGSDWKKVRGEARPAPPGAFERWGLILENNGRAEFSAPLEGDMEIKVRFRSQMFDTRQGRFAITLDGEKGKRVACEMGQLIYFEKKRPKAQHGDSKVADIRSKTNNTLELTLQGKQLTARFNNKVTAEITLPKKLGPYVLGLEWNRVSLDLMRIRSMVRPQAKWVEETVGSGS
jgi:hypothetical protein